MKKKITNAEVETYVATLSTQDSFVKTMKMPHAARQAIRVNLKTLTDRLRLYQEGRKEILDQAVKDGHAKEVGGGQYAIEAGHPEVGQELQELSQVENELDIEVFDVSALLDNDLTLAEEDVILFFRKEAE
jgi:hypothetical protein